MWEEVCDPLFEVPAIGHQMTELELDFTEEDVLKAIGELKSSSAPGPDGFSALHIKNCAQALAIPRTSMWN